MTRYLLMPFRAAPLILVAVFTVLWAFAIRGKIIGIFADVILLSWFFKYCYVLVDTVVAGQDEMPVLSVEMLNPVDEQRPLVQAIIASLGFIACWWVYHAIGPGAGLGLGALLLCALPATIGLLAISDSWLHALSPLTIGRLMKGMGFRYLVVLSITLGGGALIAWLALSLDSILMTLFLAQLVLMGVFCFIGGAIFESRIELDLNTRTWEERLSERDERHHAQARGAVLDRSYALLRLKRRGDAWANLEPWIREHCPDTHPFTEYHALLTATCAWEDPVIGDKVADGYLTKLLVNGETGLALDALQIRLASNPKFCPSAPLYAQRLTELAVAAGRKDMSRRLLENAAAQRTTDTAKPAAT